MMSVPVLLTWILLQVGYGLPTPESFEIDVDGGIDQDIFDINEALGLNLFEGDIKLDAERNSIIGHNYRWPLPIPYVLEDSLEMNAKGLILKAFEQYRLKTCIDFKPWDGEKNYISVFQGSVCWSFIGNRQEGKQQLSIGANCDTIGTIQHEFLHALGFWHEQSRSDRDDYVSIMWDRIQSGKEHNFNKYDNKMSSSLNVPYDYTSVMHYSKTSFMNGTDPTIVTNIPTFMDVIGQRMDFSDCDLQKLNRLYNCTSSLSFMDTCSFELENVCGMIQSKEDNGDWQHVSQVSAGPHTDHTHMGDYKGNGYFMHFNTSAGSVGNTAILESRILYPKRGFQCLQFYYYNSGSESDQLNILVREYALDSSSSTVRLVEMIQGSPLDYWQLYHVSLKVSRKFRVIFEGVKGTGSSNGGLSIDDINLSEMQCPQHVWHIRNFTHLLNTSPAGNGGRIYSPHFYSSKGYAFQVGLYVNGTSMNPFNLAIYLHLVSGVNDDHLQWPCAWQQATMVLLDQNPDIRQRMSNQRSITTDPSMLTDSSSYFWDRPNKVGSPAIFTNGTQFMRGPGYGTSGFLTHQRLRGLNFIKEDGVYILLTMEDISHLTSTQPNFTTTIPTTGTATPHFCENDICANGGICIVVDEKSVCRCPAGDDWWYMGEKCEKRGSTSENIIIAVSSTIAVFVVMLLVTIISTYCMRKKYHQKMKRNKEAWTLENSHSNFGISLSYKMHFLHLTERSFSKTLKICDIQTNDIEIGV
ncbi:meprin A subunit beta [Emydura macquarii macquarii]|uniref:meprin A subunit beta n=1 Tax=Emydura macquarii macquarii TaxID=1129001 RepID=UPI003529E49C